MQAAHFGVSCSGLLLSAVPLCLAQPPKQATLILTYVIVVVVVVGGEGLIIVRKDVNCCRCFHPYTNPRRYYVCNPITVTTADLSACHIQTDILVLFRSQGGEKAPTAPQLCGNKRLVLGISDEAFAALKTISESESNNIHAASLSKNLLDSDVILKMKGYPLEQTFLFHILAR